MNFERYEDAIRAVKAKTEEKFSTHCDLRLIHSSITPSVVFAVKIYKPAAPSYLVATTHGWHMSIDANVDYEKPQSPYLLVEVDMRGRAYSTGTPDCNGLELYDVYDAIRFALKEYKSYLINEDLIYFETVFDALTRAQSFDELDAIRRELVDLGFVKTPKNRKLKPRNIPYLEYEIDGFRVLAGRNNIQNDTLTLKIADRFDIWLHTKDIAGSHVIIFTDRAEVPEEVVVKAANIAAVNSKAANSSGVPVECCLAKFVKKPSGAKPGMVIYTNNRTLYVTPDKASADSFIKK